MMRTISLLRLTANLVIPRRLINKITGLSFREVTEKDYGTVMSIRKEKDLYNGRDYLPDYYAMLLRRPEYKGYAGIIDGKMVNFICVAVLDEGKTMVVLATRTKKELCGQGILKRVCGYAIEENYKVNPNLVYYAGVADKTVYYDLVHPTVKRGLQKLVQKKDIRGYRIATKRMYDVLENCETTSNVEEVFQQDLENIFYNPMVLDLFPGKRILSNWIPYECLTSNIPYIYNERCTVLGTNMKRNGNLEKSLLTFGHYSRLPSTFYYGIDVYGQNTDALPDHIMAHLKTLKQIPHNATEVTLAILYHDNVLNKSLCDKITENLGFELSYEEQQYYTIGYVWNMSQNIGKIVQGSKGSV